MHSKHYDLRNVLAGLGGVRAAFFAKTEDDETEQIGELANLFAENSEKVFNAIGDITERMAALETAAARPPLGGNDISNSDGNMIKAFANSLPIPKSVSDEQYDEIKRGFAAYIRRGKDAIPPEFHASMSVSSDPEGGYWAPTEFSQNVIKRVFDTSDMRRIADVQMIGAGEIEYPKDTNDLSGGGWVGEQEERGETNVGDVGLHKIIVHEHFEMPVVTQKLLDDSAIDIDTWLTSKIGDKMGRRENTAFVSGNGVAKPKGFLFYKDTSVTTDDAERDWGVLQYVPSGAAGGFPKISGSNADDAGALYDLIAKLKPIYRRNARWAMNRQTAAVCRKLRDNEGRFLWQDSLQEGQPSLLCGYAVEEFEDVPDIASDSFSIAFGDFKAGYRIVDRFGIRLLRDALTTKGKVKFYATKRTGGDVVDFDAIKLMKFATS